MELLNREIHESLLDESRQSESISFRRQRNVIDNKPRVVSVLSEEIHILDSPTVPNAILRTNHFDNYTSASSTIGGLPRRGSLSLRFSINATDPGILMTNASAHRLGNLYKYHVFFLYHDLDRQWVMQLIRKLESQPLSYKCCYDLRDYQRDSSPLQNMLCSSLLSERVVLVISKGFIKNLWPLCEDVVKQILYLSTTTNLTYPAGAKCARHKLLGILLDHNGHSDVLSQILSEDHRIENSALQNSVQEFLSVCSSIPCLEASHPKFWDELLLNLRREGIPVLNDSRSTLWSVASQSCGLHNGQLLAKACLRCAGFIRQRLHADILTRATVQKTNLLAKVSEDVENVNGGSHTSLESDKSELNQTESVYVTLLDRLFWKEEFARHNLSIMPKFFLIALAFLWVIGSVLVVVLIPENSSATLPVRLCVFGLPGMGVVAGAIWRWRAHKEMKLEIERRYFLKCIFLNACLYQEGQNYLLATRKNKAKDEFAIFIFNYCLRDCVNELSSYLALHSAGDKERLKKLVQNYTSSEDYLFNESLAAQLCCAFSVAYGLQLLQRGAVFPLEQRHTRRQLCLCQFVQEFLAAYLPMTRHPADCHSSHLYFLLTRYLQWPLVAGDFEQAERITFTSSGAIG